MDHCQPYQELISQSLDQPLSPTERQALDEHLAQCPRCRALSQQLSQIHDELAHWPEEEEVPDGFADGVMAKIQALEERPKVVPLWRRPRVLASLVACALLCVGLLQTNLGRMGASGSSTPSTNFIAAEETAPESASVSPRYSAVQSAEDGTAAAPDGEELLQAVSEALGTTPGALLVVDQVPVDLNAAGTWHTTAQGDAFLVLEQWPEEAVYQDLCQNALLCLERGDGPLVLLPWS
jgi:anti-sigma factor RsiW